MYWHGLRAFVQVKSAVSSSTVGSETHAAFHNELLSVDEYPPQEGVLALEEAHVQY